jgi:hypothetical protein
MYELLNTLLSITFRSNTHQGKAGAAPVALQSVGTGAIQPYANRPAVTGTPMTDY